MDFFHVATLASYFWRCDVRVWPRVEVARFHEMTKVSFTSCGRSSTTRLTDSVIAVSRASIPRTYFACHPHSAPLASLAYHSTPPSGLPVRITCEPLGALDFSSW